MSVPAAAKPALIGLTTPRKLATGLAIYGLALASAVANFPAVAAALS